jgi:hypothetical protein
MATSIDRVNVFIFNPQIAIIFNLAAIDSNTGDGLLPQDFASFAVWLSGKASDDHGDATFSSFDHVGVEPLRSFNGPGLVGSIWVF